MEILEISIKAEGSVGKLAEALDIRQNVISNWRARGVPKPWAQVLLLKYGSELTQAQAAPAQLAINAVAQVQWDGKTERRKLDAPIDRRVSPASLAHAEFLLAQAANPKQQGV